MIYERIDTSHLVYRHQPASARRARLLPLLLLVLVVSTLVIITLSQIAVMHQAVFAPQQLVNYGGGGTPIIAGVLGGAASASNGATTATAMVNNRKAATTTTTASTSKTTEKSFKLEPLISRNVTPIDVNAHRLRNAENAFRVARIVARASRKDVATLYYHHMSVVASTNNSDDFLDNSICDGTIFKTLLPYCNQVPSNLMGELHADNHSHEKVSMDEVLEENPQVCPGGWWSPGSCLPRHRVAIIIPYRDRQSHLVTLLGHLHPILQRQELYYQIFVAEQTGNGTFNKGMLMNAAFTVAMQTGTFQCFVFHDVDLIPEDDRNMYSCPPSPRHMSVGVDEFKYILPYSTLVGGVFSIRPEHFLMVNGYSNMYWGWGGEDDDMSYRLAQMNLPITRPSISVARYRMIKHVKRKPLVWKIRGKLLNTAKKRMKYDGLNSLSYVLVKQEGHPLYTSVIIDVGTCPQAFCA